MSKRDRAEPPAGREQPEGLSIRRPSLPIGAPPRRDSVESVPMLPPFVAPRGASLPTVVPLDLAPPRRPESSGTHPAVTAPATRPPPAGLRTGGSGFPKVDPRVEPVDDDEVPKVEVLPDVPLPPRRPSSSALNRVVGPPLSSSRLPPLRPAPPTSRAPALPMEDPFADPAEDPFAQSARLSPVPAAKTAPPPARPLDDVVKVSRGPSVPERFELDDLSPVAPVARRAPPAPTVAPRRAAAPVKTLSRAAPAAGDSAYASLPPLRLSSAPPGSMAPARPSTPLLEGEVDTALQGSERAVAAHACMLALARASRSYLIYDPSNQAVRGFLDALRNSFAAYLSTYGELPLTVRPFELVLDQEVVYIERERERSLALKLFRDGVRKLTLDADTTWPELTKLLEILSIRFVGVRHDEDDLVTLLWKAGFHHINIESIEGFVPDDDDSAVPGPEGGGFAAIAIAASAKVPADFDLPAPRLPDPVRVAASPVSDEQRSALVAECASPRLPQLTIDLIRRLLVVAGDPTDPLHFDEVAPLVREARDFLLSDSRLQQLLALFDVISSFADGHPELAAQVGPLVSGFFDQRAVQKLIRSVPNDATAAPAELTKLLHSLPYDPVPVLLDLLASERSEHDRRVLRELLEGFLPARADVVIARMRETRGSLAADLLRTLSERLPDAPSLVASTLMSGEDDELQMEFLRLTAVGKTDTSTRGVLVHLLRSSSETLRVRTVEAIGEHREPGAFTLLLRHAEHRADERSSSPEEMAAVGRAMTLVDAARALEAFREWAKPPGIIQRLVKAEAHAARVRAAAAGLARHPSDDAHRVLQELAAGVTSEALRRAVDDAVAERAQRAGSAP